MALSLQGAQLKVKKLPKWDVDSGGIDLYYWMFGTRAMRLVGGSAWEAWRKATVEALVRHQRAEPGRDEHGSWDAVDAWSAQGGRIYLTAAAILCLDQCGGPTEPRRASMPAGVRAAVGALTEAMKSDDAEVRRAAESALDQIRAAYR